MNKDEFLQALQKEVSEYNKIIATEKGDWIVKGFIDIYKNIYTISVDTKVVSKVIELLLFLPLRILPKSMIWFLKIRLSKTSTLT